MTTPDFHGTYGASPVQASSWYKRCKEDSTGSGSPPQNHAHRSRARVDVARVIRSGFMVQGSGFRVQGSGFRIQVSGFGVQGSGFRVQGSGSRVQGSGGVPAT